jgi:hypothetical protein
MIHRVKLIEGASLHLEPIEPQPYQDREGFLKWDGREGHFEGMSRWIDMASFTNALKDFCPYSIGDELWGIEDYCNDAECGENGIMCYKHNGVKFRACKAIEHWQPAETMPDEFIRHKHPITGIRAIYVPEISWKDILKSGFYIPCGIDVLIATMLKDYNDFWNEQHPDHPWAWGLEAEI